MSSYAYEKRDRLVHELSWATDKFLWLALVSGAFPEAEPESPLVVKRGVSPTTLERQWKHADFETRQGSLLDKFRGHNRFVQMFVGEFVSVQALEPVEDTPIAGVLRAINYERQCLILESSGSAKLVRYGEPYYGVGCNVPNARPLVDIDVWPKKHTEDVLQQLIIID